MCMVAVKQSPDGRCRERSLRRYTTASCLFPNPQWDSCRPTHIKCVRLALRGDHINVFTPMCSLHVRGAPDLHAKWFHWGLLSDRGHKSILLDTNWPIYISILPKKIRYSIQWDSLKKTKNRYHISLWVRDATVWHPFNGYVMCFLLAFFFLMTYPLNGSIIAFGWWIH